MEKLFHPCTLFGLHQIDTYDTEQHTASGYHRRCQHRFELHSFYCRRSERRSAQSHRSQDRTGVTLIQIGSHTGYVTYVIAHIISDGSRVTRIILGDVILRFTHEVSAYVRSLGVYTSAYTSKERLRRSTHTERQHGRRDSNKVCVRAYPREETCLLQHQEPACDVQQRQTDNRQTHHSTRTESHLQTRIQTLTSRIGCTSRRIGRRLHAEEACQTGEETTGQERKPDDTVLQIKISHYGEDNC